LVLGKPFRSAESGGADLLHHPTVADRRWKRYEKAAGLNRPAAG